ncbi:hypothetical protein M378DRAFT_74466, partial [Amanita muscaria Koide BX008]
MDSSDDLDKSLDDLGDLGDLDDLDDLDPAIAQEQVRSSSPEETEHHEYPDERYRLQEALTDNYVCGPAPAWSSQPRDITATERISLEHYIAWTKSNGTELAYRLHADVLKKVTKIDILSLHAVRSLSRKLSGLQPQLVDMCPQSCMAYTGDYSTEASCCYEKDGVQCGESRYNSQKKARQQMLYVSCFDVLKAMYANAETSTLLRHRDTVLQKTLYLLDKGKDAIRTYSDFADGTVQEYLYEEQKLLTGERDVAFALSTDGAQLTMKKQSSTWIALLIILNLPPEIRYKTNNTIVPFIIPGPNNPGNLESFM